MTSRTRPSLLLIPVLLAGCGAEAPSEPATLSVQQASRAQAAATTPVVLSKARDAYSIQKTVDGYRVTELSGGAVVNVAADAHLRFSDTSLVLNPDGRAGQVYRLYRAAFGRTPDRAGLGFWIQGSEAGFSLSVIGAAFESSAEYKSVYGEAPSNAEIIERLYLNILRRAGDSGGVSYWRSILDNKLASRLEVLLAFSESSENKAAVQDEIASGIPYQESGVNYTPSGPNFAGQTYPASVDSARTLYNQQGALGYAYMLCLASFNPSWSSAVFVRGPGATYQYKVLSASNDAATRLANLNAQGALGYAFKSTEVYGTDYFSGYDVFVKGSANSNTYSYRLVQESFALDKLNSNGAQGYAFRGQQIISGVTYSLYMKDSARTGTISFISKPVKTFTTGLLEEMNTLGAQHYALQGMMFADGQSSTLYMKDSSNTTPYTYTTAAKGGASAQQGIDVFNAQAALGKSYWGDLVDGATPVAVFYTGKHIIHPLAGPTFP